MSKVSLICGYSGLGPQWMSMWFTPDKSKELAVLMVERYCWLRIWAPRVAGQMMQEWFLWVPAWDWDVIGLDAGQEDSLEGGGDTGGRSKHRTWERNQKSSYGEGASPTSKEVQEEIPQKHPNEAEGQRMYSSSSERVTEELALPLLTSPFFFPLFWALKRVSQSFAS